MLIEVVVWLIVLGRGSEDRPCLVPSSICNRKGWLRIYLSAVEPDVDRDIATQVPASLHLVSFGQPREDLDVESSPGEVDGLPAEGAVGRLMVDVLEALPADGMLVAADDSGQSPVSVVLVGTDRTFL